MTQAAMTWPDPPIRTARLVLAPLAVDDAEEMAVVLGDERMYEFTGGEPLSLDQLRERYRRLVVGRSADGTERWFNWVMRLADHGTAVGAVQATVAADGSSADVAWEVGVPWQGQGFASEAAVALVDWLVERGLCHVQACIHPEHEASAAVAARAGLMATSESVDGETVWRLAPAAADE